MLISYQSLGLSEISTRNVCLALLLIASHSIPGLLHYRKGSQGKAELMQNGNEEHGLMIYLFVALHLP